MRSPATLRAQVAAQHLAARLADDPNFVRIEVKEDYVDRQLTKLFLVYYNGTPLVRPPQSYDGIPIIVRMTGSAILSGFRRTRSPFPWSPR